MKKNEKNAIFYQTISFCLQSRCAYQDNDEVFAYIEKLHKEINNFHGSDRPLYSFCTFDDINKYLEREIAYTCRQFPKEWTVVQICKNFNPIAMSSRFDDIVNFNTGISMTIFAHSSISEMVMMEIKNNAFSNENIFEKVYALNRKISTEMNFYTMPQANEKEKAASLERYHRSVRDVELYVQDVIDKLKLFFGPWITALTGVFKSQKSRDIEKRINTKVKEFAKKKSFGESQQKMLQILARRLDLLTAEQIFLGITHILKDKPNLGYSDVDLNDCYDLLLWVKQELVYDDVETHPVILIVDEVLDQFPFETINLQQEFTRVCSFANLKKLHDRYCGSIENGYLNLTANRCQAIINPDGTLAKMEQRMRGFFGYWLPTWNVKYNQRPTNQEFYDILIKTDVLVYSGHGTGLQLLSQDNVYNLKSKAVVFLFGCGSVALSSVGLNSELRGAHTYYHIGGAPAVVGFLWTVTDFNCDLCSTKILSAWFNSTSPQPRQHFQTIDAKSWRNLGTMSEFRLGIVCDSVEI